MTTTTTTIDFSTAEKIVGEASPEEYGKAIIAAARCIRQQRGELPKPGRKNGSKYGNYSSRNEVSFETRCTGTKSNGSQCSFHKQDNKDYCKHHDPNVSHIKKRSRVDDSDSDSVSSAYKRRHTVPDEKRCIMDTKNGRCTLSRKSDMNTCGHHSGSRKRGGPRVVPSNENRCTVDTNYGRCTLDREHGEDVCSIHAVPFIPSPDSILDSAALLSSSPVY